MEYVIDDSQLQRPLDTRLRTALILLAAAAAWLAAYNLIQPLANWIAYVLLGLEQGSHLGDALAFFFYDVPKILLLLSGMIFLISIIRTFFSPERTRAMLGGKREGLGNFLAALLGVVTPFCSCSAVPLFIGFVESGIPLGVTFSFLIAAPTINEVALVMLFGLFGWRVAGLYVASGLIIASLAGFVIGRFKLERYVEDLSGKCRHRGSWKTTSVGMIVLRADGIRQGNCRQGLLYVIIGIGVGQPFTGMCPKAPWRASWASTTLVVGSVRGDAGRPLYSNAAGVIRSSAR